MLAKAILSFGLAAATATSVQAAQYSVSGVGASFGLELEAQVQFSFPSLESSISSIVGSLSKGSNRTLSHVLPVEKIYGVNIGNWLIFEPWMTPARWEAMGGQFCTSCSQCRQCEWSLSTYLGQEATNAAFQQHWETWFTQTDVDKIVAAGLNTVRIPLGFWIVEDIVDRATEPYAQGGLDQLIRGLTMLQSAGIHVLLDHHALPGVSSSNQMFAGNCTSNVEFYSSPNDYNYERAITWSVVMAWLSHVHPAFSTVFGIEAINEPIQDYSQTPNLDKFEKSFVLAIRSLELSLGIICDISFLPETITDTLTLGGLKNAIPIITKLAQQYHLSPIGTKGLNAIASGSALKSIIVGLTQLAPNKNRQRQCLDTTFMNRDWQYSTTGATIPNPADAAHGPQLYDGHLYFNFGGVSQEQTPESYMAVMCNFTRVADSASIGDAPLVFGEWAISTAFNTTSDQFLKDWGDVQKKAYSTGAGWIFWNFKVDPDAQVPEQRMWSYLDALDAGVLTQKPDEYFSDDPCASYGY